MDPRAGRDGNAPLTPDARAVFDHLAAKGASFLKDLTRATDLDVAMVEAALRELVYAGIVTSDGFAGLRGLLDRSSFAPPRFLDRFSRPVGRVPRTAQAVPAAGPGGRWSVLREDLDPRRTRSRSRASCCFGTAWSRETSQRVNRGCSPGATSSSSFGVWRPR